MAATLAKTSLYSEEDIERALQAMAFSGNNSNEAQRRLKAAGHNTPDSRTLRLWRAETHADRYQRIREEMTPKVVERVAQEAEDLAVRAVEAERGLLERIIEETPNMDRRDLAGSLRNVTTTKSLQIDKVSSPLRGRPAVVVEHRSAGNLETKLRKVLGSGVVDGTAEEVGTTELMAVTPQSPPLQPQSPATTAESRGNAPAQKD